MNTGIIRKTYIITILFFLAFFVFQIFFQNLYFDKIYNKSLKRSFEKNFTEYVNETVDKIHNNEEDINTFNFEKKTNTSILIVSEDGKILNESFYKNFNILKIKLDDSTVNIIMDGILNSNNAMLHSFKYYDKIYLEVIQIGKTEYYLPINITYDGKLYRNTNIIEYLKDKAIVYKDIIKLSGEVSSRKVSIKYIDTQKESNMLLNYCFLSLLKSNIETDEMDRTIIRQEMTYGQRNYYLISIEKQVNGVITRFLSIKEINNFKIDFSIVNVYYLLMYAIFIVTMIILFVIFTKLLSNPINTLNYTAKQIANLDFSKEANIKSGDELEELSNSINSISKNLEKTINNLKDTNNYLKKEASKRQESEQRVRYILTTMAHEFRTPLMLIQACKNVIEDELFEKKPAYYFNMIEEEINKINKLIEESIEISKLESGYFNYKPKKIDIYSLTSNVLDYFDLKIKEKNIQLISKIKKFNVYGDPIKIEQILTNFISNAVKYTPSNGKIIITIEEFDNESIIVKIKNTLANDMTEEQINLLWNKYYRVKEHDKKITKGFGLGLEICSNILKMHKSNFGSQKVDNMIEFYFTLELCKD